MPYFRSTGLKDQILRAYADVERLENSFSAPEPEQAKKDLFYLCERYVSLRTEEIYVNELDIVKEIEAMFEFVTTLGYKLEPKAEDIPEPLVITTEDEDLPF